MENVSIYSWFLCAANWKHDAPWESSSFVQNRSLKLSLPKTYSLAALQALVIPAGNANLVIGNLRSLKHNKPKTFEAGINLS